METMDKPAGVRMGAQVSLQYGHDAYGKDRFWIGVTPDALPIGYVPYSQGYVPCGTGRATPDGVPNAEGWAKLLAASLEMAALLKENVEALATPDGWDDRVRAVLVKAGVRS